MEALLGLARLHGGLRAHCLPGLNIPEEDRDSSLQRHYYELAAHGGELEAALWVARRSEDEGDASAAARFYADADEIMATTEEESEGIGQMQRYEVRAKRAELEEKQGDGEAAATLYSQASELAMAAFKTKLAMRYMARAEELQS